MISQLAYLVIASRNPDDWRVFAERVVGASVETSRQGALLVRMDAWEYRWLVIPSDADGLHASAWSVQDAQALAAARNRLLAAGVEITDLDAEGLALRNIKAGFTFNDPAGNRQEIVFGRTMLASPFVSPVGVSQFVMGDQGVGHVVLPAGNRFDECMAFWEQLMDVGLSDFATRSGGGRSGRVHWYHLKANARHHSVAFGETGHPAGCLHTMLQVATLDDVGLAIDRCAREGVPLKRSLGRHLNDGMYSFYIDTPSGFELEYGFGSPDMDWSRHEPHNSPAGSAWGHAPLK